MQDVNTPRFWRYATLCAAGTLVAVALGVTEHRALAQTVTYEYDNLGRVSSAAYADGTVIQYSYDAVGNRTVYTVSRPTAVGALQLASAAASVSEGGAGVTLTVIRTGGSYGAASVGYSTANGTATAGSDYTARSGTLAWVDGDATSKVISIPINDDAAYEGNETFTFSLSSPSGATLGTPVAATITILDNENPPPGTLQLSPANYTVAENSSLVTVTVSRTNGSAGAASVRYATSNGSASAGSDYAAASGTLTWADGDAADKTFSVSITDDNAMEASETINLTLSEAAGAALGTPSTGTVTITDNDTASVPNVPAAIYPAYEFIPGTCQPPQICTGGGGFTLESGIVNWDPPVGGPSVHHYELQRALNSSNFSNNLSIVYSGTALSTSVTLQGANPPNWYYFRVRACNASNQCSAWREAAVFEVCNGSQCHPGV